MNKSKVLLAWVSICLFSTSGVLGVEFLSPEPTVATTTSVCSNGAVPSGTITAACNYEAVGAKTPIYSGRRPIDGNEYSLCLYRCECTGVTAPTSFNRKCQVQFPNTISEPITIGQTELSCPNNIGATATVRVLVPDGTQCIGVTDPKFDSVMKTIRETCVDGEAREVTFGGDTYPVSPDYPHSENYCMAVAKEKTGIWACCPPSP